jgi:hypothetical protein
MKHAALFAASMLIFFMLIPVAYCELDSTATTLYMRSDVYTTFYVNGYGLDTSNTAATHTVTGDVNDTGDLLVGFRVYLYANNTSTEVTSGTPVGQVTRTTDGAGIQTATFAMTAHPVTIGMYAFKLVLYVMENTTWTSKAIFVSEELLTTEVEASTWTFNVYTNLTGTEVNVSFGSSSAESSVQGISMATPEFWDMAFYYLGAGNYIMFFLYPYVRLIGMGPFASIILFGIGLTAYLRFKNFYFLLLVLVMLSLGGVLNLIMGDALWGAVALVATFGLAALYWRVFR